MSAAPEMAVSELRKAYRRRVILDGVALTLAPGSLQLLSGANGAGKTTLLRILAGLERPDAGRVTLGDGAQGWRAVRQLLLARAVYLHQAPYMFDGTVSYNLGYALPRGLSKAERQTQIEQALQWAGLVSLALQDAKSLSGGERQRVALARAWLRRPRVLLLDEPTANMDTHAAARTLELLHMLKTEGRALLIASHDPQHFAALADQHYRLEAGKLSRLDHDGHVGQDTPRVTPLTRIK